mmetsp:Transcript_1404/g.1909  ORF Transcript_1404/g.1909 Transcript_1404/m.1909 type:complete len:93 (+) Transcript_1404:92-370(+)
MREAQKMMQDPAFQAHMKKVTENDSFKQSIAQTKKVMQDPKKMKEMEATMTEKLKEGQKQLEAAEKAAAEKAKEGGDKKESAEEDVKPPALN